ncbi:MAG TPA: hypothetical protein VIQ01_04450, partial [Burkholderiales bacterium]
MPEIAASVDVTFTPLLVLAARLSLTHDTFGLQQRHALLYSRFTRRNENGEPNAAYKGVQNTDRG